MISKTRGVVLHSIKYGDSSLIVHVYTEKYGRQSFMVSGVRGRKGKNKASFFMPLSLLDLEIYYKPKRDMQRISETRILIPFHDIPFHIDKNTIALFISEILYKVLKEHEENPPLFEFLLNAIGFLDVYEGNIANFHLVFLMNLSRFLGFYPNVETYEDGYYFDLKNGSFKKSVPYHPNYLEKKQSVLFRELLSVNFSNFQAYHPTGKERKGLLELVINYFGLHIESLGNINSYRILKEVFN